MRSYTVQSGDTLFQISLRFYGVGSKYPLIIDSNPILGERRVNGRVSSDGTPYIYAGDNLLIPDEVENITNPVAVDPLPQKITAEKGALTVVIDNKNYEFFTGFTINSNIGSLDTVSISSPFFDVPEYTETFQLLAYKKAVVYYGGDLFLNGILLAPGTAVDPDSKTLSLNIYPKCGVLNDCPLPYSAFPLDFNGLNVKQIAEKIAKYYGVKVEFIGDPGAIFEEVSMSPSQKCLDFLVGLAKDRGFLITNNTAGDLLFWQGVDSAPVAFVEEGEVPFVSCSPSTDPQNYYSSITGLSPATELKEASSYTWENPFMGGILRPLTMEFNDSESGDLEKNTKAAAGRMFGSACKYSLILNTHFYDGGIFLKNKTIRAISPNGSIYKETNFLIESASLTREDDGDLSSLGLVLPGAFTGQLPKDVPWVP